MTMQEKTLSFEQLPELIQNLVERIEALEKTVREKQQPQPLEGELMSVEDVCKLLGKSKSAVYRTVRCHDIPFIRQGNRLYFDRATIKKWLEKKQNIECITNMEEFEKFMTPDPWRYKNRRWWFVFTPRQGGFTPPFCFYICKFFSKNLQNNYQ